MACDLSVCRHDGKVAFGGNILSSSSVTNGVNQKLISQIHVKLDQIMHLTETETLTTDLKKRH